MRSLKLVAGDLITLLLCMKLCEIEGNLTDFSSDTLCQWRPCLTGGEVYRRSETCDGIFHCTDLTDECMCGPPKFETEVYLLCQNILSSRNKKVSGKVNCSHGFIECDNCESEAMCLEVSKICDGKADCGDCIDEIYCEDSQNVLLNTGGCNRSCKTDICMYSCDSKENEENHCKPEKSLFHCVFDYEDETYFSEHYMNMANTSIDWRRRFDGQIDCNNIADEWGYCDDEITRCIKNKKLKTWYFSSPYRSNPEYFMIIQWIFGTLALLANCAVIASTITDFVRSLRPRDLKRRPSTVKPSPHLMRSKLCNTILVFSLALADFAFGLQMILIAVSGSLLSQEYWKQAHEWQTSTECSMIGWLGALSFQVSAFTVLTLAVFRHNSVARPFQPFKLKHAIFVFVGIWSVSGLLATVPLLRSTPALQNYFTSFVWMPANSTITSSLHNLTQIRHYVRNILLLSSNPINTTIESVNDLSWLELEGIVKSINPQFAGWKYYGYYSEFSICIPILVNSRNQPYWEFSLSLITFNFLLYLMVPFIYWDVYKRSKIRSTSIRHGGMTPGQYNTRKNSREKENKDMHSLISLLVITDILCWMPGCLFTFIGCIAPATGIDNHITAKLTLLTSELNSIINPFLYSKRLRDCVLNAVFYLKIRLVSACNKKKRCIRNQAPTENRNSFVDETKMESVFRPAVDGGSIINTISEIDKNQHIGLSSDLCKSKSTVE